MSGCRYCSGSSVRYVVYVRSEGNRPSTKGIACTSILACDCADDTQRRAMSAGYQKPEEKSPATNAREFARHADAQGMVNGIHWAIDPTPRTQRLMMQAWPYPSQPARTDGPASYGLAPSAARLHASRGSATRGPLCYPGRARGYPPAYPRP